MLKDVQVTPGGMIEVSLNDGRKSQMTPREALERVLAIVRADSRPGIYRNPHTQEMIEAVLHAVVKAKKMTNPDWVMPRSVQNFLDYHKLPKPRMSVEPLIVVAKN